MEKYPEILGSILAGKQVTVYTAQGLTKRATLAGALCENNTIHVESIPLDRGIPCYPLIVDCKTGFSSTSFSKTTGA